MPLAGLLLGSLLLAASAPAAPGALSREGVREAARYSRERGGLSLLVHQRGRLLLEEYASGGQGTGRRIASVTKSLWGLAAAAAAQDGLLSFDELVADSFPEWRADPRKARVRVRDLLTMTSGLDPGYEALYAVDPDDAPRTALALPAVDEPGARFTYGPANMEVFGALLERKLRGRGLSPLRYLEQRVLEPAGSGYEAWPRDKAGHPMMSSGVTMTARQLLAVGRLLARNGAVHRRRLIAAERLAALLEGTAANPAYGMTLWLNLAAASPEAVEVDVERTLNTGRPYDGWARACISRAAPADLALMLGSWNQRVYAVPSLDLVVVRQGQGGDFTDAEFLGRLFKRD